MKNNETIKLHIYKCSVLLLFTVYIRRVRSGPVKFYPSHDEVQKNE